MGVAKGLDLVLMDERRVPLAVRSHIRPAEVGQMLDEFRPDVVAIDSPPQPLMTRAIPSAFCSSRG